MRQCSSAGALGTIAIALMLTHGCSSKGSGGKSDQGGTAGDSTAGGGAGGAGGAAGEAGNSGGTVSGGASGGNSNTGGTATGGMGGGKAGGSGGSKTGGAPGTSTGGSSATGGAPAMPCSANPRCDDFEKHTVGMRPGAPWQSLSSSSGALTVDNTRAYSGQKSMKFTINPGESQHIHMVHGGNGLLPARKLSVRMMAYLDDRPAGTGLHWAWIRIEGNATAESGGKNTNSDIGTGANGSGHLQVAHGAGAPGGFQDCASYSATSVPIKQWACVIFSVDADTDGALLVVNNKADEFTELIGGRTPGGGCVPGYDYTEGHWYVPPVTRVSVGFNYAHTLSVQRTLWIDDVTVSDQPLTCPAPL
jgi:hypothetical protein